MYEFGDDGHWHTPQVTIVSYACWAALSWAFQANRDDALPPALDVHVFRDSAKVIGRLALDLGNVYLHPGLKSSGVPSGEATTVLARMSYADALWHVLQGTIGGTDPETRWWWDWENLFKGERPLTVEGLDEASAHIDDVMEPLSGARMTRPDVDVVAAEFRLGAAMQKHACRLGQALASTRDVSVREVSAGTCKGLAEELRPIIEEYRRLWLLRSRPGGLANSAGRLERLLAAYEA